MPQAPRVVPPPPPEEVEESPEVLYEFEITDEIVDDGYNDVGDNVEGGDGDDDEDEGRKPDTPHVSDDEGDDDDDKLVIDDGPGTSKPVSIDTVPEVPQVSTRVSVVPPTSDTVGPPTIVADRFGFDVQQHRLSTPIGPDEVLANQKALSKLWSFNDAIKKSARFKGSICWSGLLKLSTDPDYFAVISLDGFSDIPIPRCGVRLLSYLTLCPNIIWTVIDPTGTRFYDGLTYVGVFLKSYLLENGRVSTSVVNFGIQSGPESSTVVPSPGTGPTSTTTTSTTTTTTSTTTPATTTEPPDTPAPLVDPIRVAVTLESLPDGFPVRLNTIPKPPPFDWSKAIHEILSCSDRRSHFRRLSAERLFPRLVRDTYGRCDNTQLQRRRELEVQNACGHRAYRYYLAWRKLTDADKSSFRTFAQG